MKPIQKEMVGLKTRSYASLTIRPLYAGMSPPFNAKFNILIKKLQNLLDKDNVFVGSRVLLLKQPSNTMKYPYN